MKTVLQQSPKKQIILLFCVFLLIAVDLSAQEADRFPLAAAPIAVTPDQMETMTFTRLLFQSQQSYELAVSSDDINIWILKTLRMFGYNVLGAENLLFGVDHSAKAEKLLGGTVKKLGCPRISKYQKKCYMDIHWELFDSHTKKVVYSTLTVAEHYVSTQRALQAKDIQQLLFENLKSLLKRQNFVSHLKKKKSNDTSSDSLELAYYQACESQNLVLPGMLDKAQEATVLIQNGNSHGSGFFISNDGVLLTAAHVVQGSSTVHVVSKDGQSYQASVMRVDVARDIAALKIEDIKSACLLIETRGQHPGDEVFSIGTPLDTQLSFSVSKGIISGIQTVENQVVLQTDASINAGNSGGPLLNNKGKVVGIAVAKLAGAGVEGIAFAIPAQGALVTLRMAAGERTKLSAIPPSSQTAEPEIPSYDPADKHSAETFKGSLSAYTVEPPAEEMPPASRQRHPYRKPVVMGVVLTVVGVPFVPAAIVSFQDDRTTRGISLLTVGTGLTIGGIALLIKGAQKKKAYESTFTQAPFKLAPYTLKSEFGVLFQQTF